MRNRMGSSLNLDTTVVGLQGFPIVSTPPTNGQALVFDGTNWVPTTVQTDGGGFPEAPTDGQYYSRQGSTASWELATVPPVGQWDEYVYGYDGYNQQWIPVVTGAYVNSAFLRIDGSNGPMTGPLVLVGDATQPLEPVTLQQFDAALASLPPATTVGDTLPTNPQDGALYWDLPTAKLFLWDGMQWVATINTPEGSGGGGGGPVGDFVPQLDPTNDVAVSTLGGIGSGGPPLISAFETPTGPDGDTLAIRLQRDVDGTAIFLRGPTFPDASSANGLQMWLGDGGNLLFNFTNTGQINLPAMPVNPMDATPRQYVDDAVAANGWPALGVTDGSNAAPGYVGEYLVSQQTFGIGASGGIAAVVSLSLTPGDWDVSGNAAFSWVNGGIATNILASVGIHTTSAVMPPGVYSGADGSAQLWMTGQNQNEAPTIVAGPKRYNVTAATTVYLNAQAFWAGADSLNVGGTIRARRMR